MKQMNPVMPSLLLNFGILILIGLFLAITKNPLALFGLLLLRDMPFWPGLPEDEELSNPIGFVD